MKLGEIRNYIKQRGESSLTDVATHFDISQDAAKFAIEYWIGKGKIAQQGSACGSSCNGCGDANENYQWVNTNNIIHWL